LLYLVGGWVGDETSRYILLYLVDGWVMNVGIQCLKSSVYCLDNNIS